MRISRLARFITFLPTRLERCNPALIHTTQTRAFASEFDLYHVSGGATFKVGPSTFTAGGTAAFSQAAAFGGLLPTALDVSYMRFSFVPGGLELPLKSALGNLQLISDGTGHSRSGIGAPLNKRRQGFAIHLAQLEARLCRALSVAMPVLAYICRYSFETKMKAKRDLRVGVQSDRLHTSFKL
jgi:hypothetical protein